VLLTSQIRAFPDPCFLPRLLNVRNTAVRIAPMPSLWVGALCTFILLLVAAEKKEPPGKEYSVQRLLLGTHTSDNEQNYVMLADVQLPLEDAEIDSRQYEDEKAETGGFGASAGKVSAPALGCGVAHLTLPLLWHGFVPNVQLVALLVGTGHDASARELARTLLTVPERVLSSPAVRLWPRAPVVQRRSKWCSRLTTTGR